MGSKGRTQRRRSGITRSETEWNGMPRSRTEDVKRAAPSYTGSFREKSGMERRFKAFEPGGLGFAERNFKRFKSERNGRFFRGLLSVIIFTYITRKSIHSSYNLPCYIMSDYMTSGV